MSKKEEEQRETKQERKEKTVRREKESIEKL